jgi:tRNA A37 threonylcarbamoyladenosine biosynthesis protein TsaE
VPDLATARAAVSEFITIMTSAPPDIVAPVIATIAAAPVFREKLQARGFITKLSGPTGAGKTTLVRSAYAMLGDFHQQPGCITTWRSTTTTLEQAVHTLRDLPVFIDDYRTNDSGATESLRNIAMMAGNGVGRVRSHRRDGELGVESALRGNSLVLATGEHIAEHDGGVAARLLELDAHDIDYRRLIGISVDGLRRLPHLYGSYVAWLALLPRDTWLEAQGHHAIACDDLGRSSRATENVATLLIGLQLFMKFLERGVSATNLAVQQYQDVVNTFQADLPQLIRLQELRIGEATIEKMALSELARGVRSGQVALRHVPDSAASGPKSGLIIGFDSQNLYLPPSETERWVSDQLRRAGVIAKPIGRGNLGSSLTERDQRRQVVLAGRRPHCWVLARVRLSDEWRELFA